MEEEESKSLMLNGDIEELLNKLRELGLIRKVINLIGYKHVNYTKYKNLRYSQKFIEAISIRRNEIQYIIDERIRYLKFKKIPKEILSVYVAYKIANIVKDNLKSYETFEVNRFKGYAGKGISNIKKIDIILKYKKYFKNYKRHILQNVNYNDINIPLIYKIKSIINQIKKSDNEINNILSLTKADIINLSRQTLMIENENSELLKPILKYYSKYKYIANKIKNSQDEEILSYTLLYLLKHKVKYYRRLNEHKSDEQRNEGNQERDRRNNRNRKIEEMDRELRRSAIIQKDKSILYRPAEEKKQIYNSNNMQSEQNQEEKDDSKREPDNKGQWIQNLYSRIRNVK
ncbi:MAG: hypothetical protein QXI16_00255 [Sulfolobaceae archaeon]